MSISLSDLIILLIYFINNTKEIVNYEKIYRSLRVTALTKVKLCLYSINVFDMMFLETLYLLKSQQYIIFFCSISYGNNSNSYLRFDVDY